MKEKILNLGNWVGAVCFAAVAVIFFFWQNKSYPIIVQLLALLLLPLLFVGVIKLRNNTTIRNVLESQPKNVYIFCACFMLTIQLILVIGINFVPITDASHIDKICYNFVTGNEDLYAGLDIYHRNYLERYSNQWGIFLAQSFIYKLSYMLTGEVHRTLLPLVNVILMQVSYFLTYKIAGLVFHRKKQVIMSVIVLTACPVLYVYSCVFYTDTLSMPLMLSAIYFGILAVNVKTRKSAALYIALSSVSTAIGYLIKGNIAILAVAFLIYMLFKSGIKRFMTYLVAIILSFVIATSGISSVMKQTGAVTDEGVEKYSFPVTHWVMMGLYGRGGYNDEEFRYTFFIEGKDAKREANIEVIKNRLSDMGVSGFLMHLVKKINYTWYGGAYQSTTQFLKSEQDSITSFFENSGVYRVWCFLFQSSLILLMLCSFVSGAVNKKTNEMALLRLAQLGLFLFLLIWETRSRYMLNLLPMYIIIAVDGANVFEQFYHKRIKRNKEIS